MIAALETKKGHPDENGYGAYCRDCSRWMLTADEGVAVPVQTTLSIQIGQVCIRKGTVYVCPQCKHSIVSNFGLLETMRLPH